MKYKGYIESIEDKIVHCLLFKTDGPDLVKYTLEIDKKVFKEDIEEGIPVRFDDEKPEQIEVIKLPPLTIKTQESPRSSDVGVCQ